jgi:hypothetical protein
MHFMFVIVNNFVELQSSPVLRAQRSVLRTTGGIPLLMSVLCSCQLIEVPRSSFVINTIQHHVWY